MSEFEDEGKVTILKNWDETHLKYLKRKMDARGIEMLVKGRSAVIRGRHWASLEQLKGQVSHDTCMTDDLEAFLEE